MQTSLGLLVQMLEATMSRLPWQTQLLTPNRMGHYHQPIETEREPRCLISTRRYPNLFLQLLFERLLHVKTYQGYTSGGPRQFRHMTPLLLHCITRTTLETPTSLTRSGMVFVFGIHPFPQLTGCTTRSRSPRDYGNSDLAGLCGVVYVVH